MNVISTLYKLWLLWVGMFPANSVFGSPEQTAGVALVLAIGLVGWLIRRAFGEDPGIR